MDTGLPPVVEPVNLLIRGSRCKTFTWNAPWGVFGHSPATRRYVGRPTYAVPNAR